MSSNLKPALIVGLAVVALMLVGVACGGAEAPAAAPASTGDSSAAATAAPAQPAAQPTAIPPTATPPPAATVRPTATPAPTIAARTAPTPVPSSGPIRSVVKEDPAVRMSAYADTKDWDPLGSSSLSSVISYSQLYNQLVQFDNVDVSAVVETWPRAGKSTPRGRSTRSACTTV